MNFRIYLPVVYILLFFGYSSFSKNTHSEKKNICEQCNDSVLIENMIMSLQNTEYKNTADLVVLAGKMLLGKPYEAHTLEKEQEELVINLREFDCTTLAENCLALARTAKTALPGFETFTRELQNMRYYNGIVDGYESRIHYFCDWIFQNDKNGIVQDLSKEIGKMQKNGMINFMSTHPQSYRQLKNDSAIISLIAEREKIINQQFFYYVPKNQIYKIEKHLKNGDIIGITTSIKGLHVSHVGILIWVNNRVHLLHASSEQKKVVISDETLEDYLLKINSVTGIMVARPL